MRDQLHRWFTSLRAIAQYGLTYSKDPYDRERFEQVAAIGTEIAVRLTGETEPRVQQALQLESGPPSPKLDVRAAVFHGDTILMVREASDGLWSLPGGWIDIGESPAQAAAREVKEETGIDCRVRKLIAVVDRNRHPHPAMLLHVYKLFFLCDLLGDPTPRPSLETTDVGFFTLTNLPPISTGRVLREQIESAYRHRYQPELATEFD
jgi:ADP-ribose pyrophosphatase YjhB (NUDIX family)